MTMTFLNFFLNKSFRFVFCVAISLLVEHVDKNKNSLYIPSGCNRLSILRSWSVLPLFSDNLDLTQFADSRKEGTSVSRHSLVPRYYLYYSISRYVRIFITYIYCVSYFLQSAESLTVADVLSRICVVSQPSRIAIVCYRLTICLLLYLLLYSVLYSIFNINVS